MTPKHNWTYKTKKSICTEESIECATWMLLSFKKRQIEYLETTLDTCWKMAFLQDEAPTFLSEKVAMYFELPIEQLAGDFLHDNPDNNISLSRNYHRLCVAATLCELLASRELEHEIIRLPTYPFFIYDKPDVIAVAIEDGPHDVETLNRIFENRHDKRWKTATKTPLKSPDGGPDITIFKLISL